jgi:hypothetical protein
MLDEYYLHVPEGKNREHNQVRKIFEITKPQEEPLAKMSRGMRAIYMALLDEQRSNLLTAQGKNGSLYLTG